MLHFDLQVVSSVALDAPVRQLQTKMHTEKRVIVMSTPEFGTMSEDGKSPPFDEKIMETLGQLQRIDDDGVLNFAMGFDRANSSTAHPEDARRGAWWESEPGIKSSFWFYGYRTRVKACALVECQHFDGVLVRGSRAILPLASLTRLRLACRRLCASTAARLHSWSRGRCRRFCGTRGPTPSCVACDASSRSSR